jgi:hypothetical protein
LSWNNIYYRCVLILLKLILFRYNNKYLRILLSSTASFKVPSLNIGSPRDKIEITIYSFNSSSYFFNFPVMVIFPLVDSIVTLEYFSFSLNFEVLFNYFISFFRVDYVNGIWSKFWFFSFITCIIIILLFSCAPRYVLCIILHFNHNRFGYHIFLI